MPIPVHPKPRREDPETVIASPTSSPTPEGPPISFAPPVHEPAHESTPKRQAREGPDGDPSVDVVNDVEPTTLKNPVCGSSTQNLRDDEAKQTNVTHCVPAHLFNIGTEVGCQKIKEEKQSQSKDFDRDELAWRSIGSGSWARTFVGATRLPLTTKSGPCSADVFRRIVRDARTGKVIVDCYVDDVPDAALARVLPQPCDIRVELVTRDAAKWFKTKGPDVVEIYSPPRIVQEAGLRTYGGKRLKLGW